MIRLASRNRIKNLSSSQLCSDCEYKNEHVKDLRIREWTCPECGSHHDRDVNATRNIRKDVLRLTAGTAGLA